MFSATRDSCRRRFRDRFAVPDATIHSGIKREVFYPPLIARAGWIH